MARASFLLFFGFTVMATDPPASAGGVITDCVEFASAE